MILGNLAIVVEILCFNIKFINCCRGFCTVISMMIALILVSFEYSTTRCIINAPLFFASSPFLIITIVLIAFLYSSNWILGSIQILIMIGGIDFYYFYYPATWFQDKPFLFAISISSAISLLLTIYYLEYFQRKSIFRRIEAKKQRKVMENILEQLPIPLIISQNGKVNYINNDLYKIEENLNPDSNHKEEEKNNNSSRELIKKNSEDKLNMGVNILIKLECSESNSNFYEIIGRNELVKEAHLMLPKTNKKKQIFEAVSIMVEIENEPTILYMLKDLTNYEKVKDLKSKKKFQRIYLASITHDFRTPLSIISGNTELLLDLEENQGKRKYILYINKAATMLSFLVQDILDFSQLKAGCLKLNIKKFNLLNEANIIIDLFREKFEQKHLYLTLKQDSSLPDIVMSDANRIKQVLMNLVSNAFKFTLEGGVEININVSPNINNLISISVKDTGVGIPETSIAQLFREYGRLECHTNLNPNGIGLGLKICKQIVEKLGGTIEVTSLVNVGTTFSFSFANHLDENEIEIEIENRNNSIHINHEINLISTGNQRNFEEAKAEHKENCPDNLQLEEIKMTKKEPSLMANQLESIAKADCACPQLLIVDDEYLLREVLCNFSSKFNIKYDQAQNGVEAIDFVKAKALSNCCKTYKLVLMDFNMPLMNGVESGLQIQTYLSEHNLKAKTTIVLLSGLGNDEYKVIENMSKSIFKEIEEKPLSYIKFKALANKYIFNTLNNI